MNFIRTISFAWGFLCAAAFVTLASAQDDARLLYQQAIKAAVEKVSPSVVQIEMIGGLEVVDNVQTNNGATTGTIVSEDGYVVSSSFNFIGKPASLIARLADGSRAAAEIVARDESRKLTLLKLETDQRLPVPAIAARDQLKVGETTIALGKIYSEKDCNISVGILSATHRIWDRAIQADAKISPANFGGPMINLRGEVIGILTPMNPSSTDLVAGADWYDSGIGFAAPMEDVVARLGQLKKGDLKIGRMGIAFEGSDIYVDPARIAVCRKESPAGLGGIQRGDVIEQLNGRKVSRQAEFKHALGALYAGDVVKGKLDRNGEKLDFQVTLVDELPPHQPMAIGIVPRSDKQPGVIVDAVLSDTGLEPGDRIVQLDEEEIKTTEELGQQLLPFSVGEKVKLGLVRDEKRLTVEVSLRKKSADDIALQSFGDNKFDLVKIEVPEASNQCVAVVPQLNNELAGLPGLVVWLGQPGKLSEEQVSKAWGGRSSSNNMIVLVAQPQGDKWTPDEAEFVQKAIAAVANSEEFDRSNVTIAGRESAGVMAALVVSKQRSLFRGLVMIDASLPRAAREMETSPVQPLLIQMITTKAFAQVDEVGRDVERLRRAMFPIKVTRDANSDLFSKANGELDGSIAPADEIVEWARTVNRL